jgi:hypothetical protein
MFILFVEESGPRKVVLDASMTQTFNPLLSLNSFAELSLQFFIIVVDILHQVL